MNRKQILNKTTFIIFIFAILCFAAPLYAQDAASAEGSKDEGLPAFTLDEGEITVQVAKKDNQFKVQTPSAVLAVRGTEFNVKTGDAGKTEVHVLDGTVAAINDIGEVLLDVGKAAEILKDILPEAFDFDVGEFREILNLWQGGLTKGAVRDFIKGKVKEKIKEEVNDKLNIKGF